MTVTVPSFRFEKLSGCTPVEEAVLLGRTLSVVVKLTVSSVQVSLVLNCHRSSNSNHQGFKKRKEEDSGSTCPGVLLFFERIDILVRLYLPCPLNDIVTYRRCG